uniref:Uncharacterized protein n=1 Tax=Rhizophora mucronata TaxID=61149 RepID=A0A2P2Q343_RHIMU
MQHKYFRVRERFVQAQELEQCQMKSLSPW